MFSPARSECECDRSEGQVNELPHRRGDLLGLDAQQELDEQPGRDPIEGREGRDGAPQVVQL
jgi:hypothetical protein